MANNTDPAFNEEEVGHLLRRAIEFQEADRQRTDKQTIGLSLEEIQRIAAEVGIDPKYIDMALHNRGLIQKSPNKPGFWGSPATLELEQTVPGELTGALMEELLAEIRDTYKFTHGHFGQLNNSFEWTSTLSTGSHLLVRAQQAGDNTRITVAERMDGYLLLTHLWTIFPLIFGILFALTRQLPQFIPVFLVIAATLFLGARWLAYRIYKSRKKHHEKLMGQLVAIVARSDRIDSLHVAPQTETTASTIGRISEEALNPPIDNPDDIQLPGGVNRLKSGNR